MDRGLTAEKRKAEDGEAGIKKPRTLGASGQKQQSSSFEQDLELEFGEGRFALDLYTGLIP